MSEIKGKISQIIGPVVDINFENSDKLPNLLDAIEVVKEDGSKVILECQKHISHLLNAYRLCFEFLELSQPLMTSQRIYLFLKA